MPVSYAAMNEIHVLRSVFVLSCFLHALTTSMFSLIVKIHQNYYCIFQIFYTLTTFYSSGKEIWCGHSRKAIV